MPHNQRSRQPSQAFTQQSNKVNMIFRLSLVVAAVSACALSASAFVSTNKNGRLDEARLSLP
jgi:hypothetical protein